MKNNVVFKVYLLGLGLGAAFASTIATLIAQNYGRKQYKQGFMDGAVKEALEIAKILGIDEEVLKKQKSKLKPNQKDGKIIQFKSKES